MTLDSMFEYISLCLNAMVEEDRDGWFKKEKDKIADTEEFNFLGE